MAPPSFVRSARTLRRELDEDRDHGRGGDGLPVRRTPGRRRARGAARRRRPGRSSPPWRPTASCSGSVRCPWRSPRIPAGRGTYDAVLVLVKTYDTAAAAELAAPLVGPATVVATLQNGIGGADVLGEAFGPRARPGGRDVPGRHGPRARPHPPPHARRDVPGRRRRRRGAARRRAHRGRPAGAGARPRRAAHLEEAHEQLHGQLHLGAHRHVRRPDGGRRRDPRPAARHRHRGGRGRRRAGARPRPRGLRAHEHVRARLVGRRAAVDAPGRRGRGDARRSRRSTGRSSATPTRWGSTCPSTARWSRSSAAGSAPAGCAGSHLASSAA